MAISWMQRHKKWLIVTIWISTIAFVGAGFVGWGSYDYGKSDGAVATVNGNEVPFKDLQNEYNALYSQYKQMFGENFNQELAKQLKLEDAALQRVLQKHVILNYADEVGLAVTDKEVAKELVKISSFLKDGKFDKNTYMTVLKQNRKSPAEFEEQLKQDLLIAKVQNIFRNELTKNEIKNISQLLYAQDKVSINIIDSKDLKISLTEKMIKEHWEKTKENYKSPNGYKIAFSKIENIEGKDKKAMKKIALKEYLKAKKGEITLAKTKTIFENSDFFSIENMEKIKKEKANTVLKPIYHKDNNYYVIKLIEKVKPQILTYDEVKANVEADLKNIKTSEVLSKKANTVINNFKGKDIGYISRDSNPKIDGLKKEEVTQLVQKIFSSTIKTDFISFENKTVVFDITDTKILPYDSKNDATVISAVSDLKNNTVFNNLLSQLEKKYEIKSYMEKK
jgi:peptidyl-prolyl cis-trans isomerase D